MKQVIHFILVPDGSAARRLRRIIAENAAQSDVVVGTWPELITHAENAYIIPKNNNNWNENFQTALKELPDPFWSESFPVSVQETTVSIQNTLCLLVSATDPDATIDIPESKHLQERPRQYVADLKRLLKELDGQLPTELAAIKYLLAADAADTIRHIHVYHHAHVPALSRWQAALIQKLNRDANIVVNQQLQTCLDALFTEQPQSKQNTGLTTLQTGLFLPPAQKQNLDDTVQWVGVRDYQQEAEVAAGMVQSMLASDSELKACDIAVLLPNSFEYLLAVDDAFSKAGLATSGLPLERWQTDLGREAVFHFLYCRKKPAPAMALAVCLTSPLMPWTHEEGGTLAQKVMDGDYRLKALPDASKEARKMLDLLREGDDRPGTLNTALKSFVALLNGGDNFTSHVYEAKATADNLCLMLESMNDIEWMALRRAATPKNITAGDAPNFNLEGVTVWREGHEPWRSVRSLIVLGFKSGNYPVASGVSPVFVADDLDSIHEHLGLPVMTPASELKQRRARFKRQLSAVSDEVTFLIPRRDSAGASQAPSESLVFMQQLFNLPKDASADEMILELDSDQDRQQIRCLAITAETEATPLRTISVQDMHFNRDLLSLRKDDEGNPKPESPSGLETLMVSRLAWLLSRIKAEPLAWAPERPNVLLLGTLAHQVFENLFQRGEPVPSESEINSQVEPLLDEAIRQNGPFLRAAQWQVEKRHLTTATIKAAQAWRSALETLGANILGNEEWLEGHLNGVRIHGQVDVILGLSDDRLLVVDYKRSSSSSRKPRMQKGYDSQANLYRTMLQTGGPKDKKNNDLINKLKKANSTGIVYYMLNDQVSLTDSLLMESGAIPGWEVMGGDVASGAITLIEKGLSEIKKGEIKLNRESDKSFFDNTAGVKPYAFDRSPLIELFIVPDDESETSSKSEVAK